MAQAQTKEPRMTTPKQTAAIARKKARYPNRVDLSIEGRAQRELRDLDHGTTPEMDRVPTISMTAGLAPPPKRSQTIFRGEL